LDVVAVVEIDVNVLAAVFAAQNGDVGRAPDYVKGVVYAIPSGVGLGKRKCKEVDADLAYIRVASLDGNGASGASRVRARKVGTDEVGVVVRGRTATSYLDYTADPDTTGASPRTHAADFVALPPRVTGPFKSIAASTN
jgi:hypothetical protein